MFTKKEGRIKRMEEGRRTTLEMIGCCLVEIVSKGSWEIF